jgi:predicted dehydrogenase
VGTTGTIRSTGPDLGRQTVTLFTKRGFARPRLTGKWFPDGFRGTILELLAAVEDARQPANNARDNLRGLALCFAACRSADTGTPQVPGKLKSMAI